MLRNIIIAAAALISAYANAGTLGVHGFSYHPGKTYETDGPVIPGYKSCDQGVGYTSCTTYGPRQTRVNKNFNNTNPGLYYIADSGATVGFYRNSYHRDTVYAGWTWSTDVYGAGPVRVSGVLSLALASGYSTLHSVGLLRPMALPGLRMHIGDAAVRWSALPARGGLFQHVSLEWKL